MKPGEVYDIKGIPIYPGDLLRSYHFTGRRRKKYYLYHVAVWDEKQNVMSMVPTFHLEPSKSKNGGQCWLSQNLVDGGETQIISGCGPGDYLDYEDRPKRKNGN